MTGNGAWQSRAACAGLNPYIFTSLHPDHHMQAAEVCATCPVTTACLASAYDKRGRVKTYLEGTYGGVHFVDGHKATGYRGHRKDKTA